MCSLRITPPLYKNDLVLTILTLVWAAHLLSGQLNYTTPAKWIVLASLLLLA